MLGCSVIVTLILNPCSSTFSCSKSSVNWRGVGGRVLRQRPPPATPPLPLPGRPRPGTELPPRGHPDDDGVRLSVPGRSELVHAPRPPHPLRQRRRPAASWGGGELGGRAVNFLTPPLPSCRRTDASTCSTPRRPSILPHASAARQNGQSRRTRTSCLTFPRRTRVRAGKGSRPPRPPCALFSACPLLRRLQS